MRFGSIFGVGVLVLCASTALGVSYDEGVNGDLSGNRLAPTSLGTLGLGSNLLTATSGKPGGVTDLEYFTITIGAGQLLSHLNLNSYVGLDGTAFIGVQSGTTFTETNTAPNVANLLGWSHFGPGVGNLGTDILDDIGNGAGSIKFTPPLGSGNYTFWAQQTGANSCTYTFDFQVTPAPGVVGAMGVAGLMITGRRRRM